MPSRKRKRAESIEDSQVPVEQWTIVYETPSGDLKQKKDEFDQRSALQVSPFTCRSLPDQALDQRFSVEPHEQWYSMRTYQKFVVEDETYRNGDYVYVKPTDGLRLPDLAQDDERQYWIAKILEVRAGSTTQVYARIYWLYWPEDLPHTCTQSSSKTKMRPGRRSYHGEYEVVASNHMDIVDVNAMAGRLDVEQWYELDVENTQTGVYFRQLYDHRTNRFSKIKRHCLCESPSNPDKILIFCNNAGCKTWLHAECLFGQAKADIHSKFVTLLSNLESPLIEIVDRRPDVEEDKKIWTVDVPCLKCGIIL